MLSGKRASPFESLLSLFVRAPSLIRNPRMALGWISRMEPLFSKSKNLRNLVLIQFREPAAQNSTSTQLHQNRGAVATGSGSFSLNRSEIQSFCGRVVARGGPGRYRSSVLML